MRKSVLFTSKIRLYLVISLKMICYFYRGTLSIVLKKYLDFNLALLSITIQSIFYSGRDKILHKLVRLNIFI